VHVAVTDAQLVARCREGDDDAWRELVERFSRYVYAIAVQAFRLPQADAEDVFQEVFARAYVNLPKLRDDSAIRPWLGQLTRRLCLDTLRAGAREQVGDLPEPSGVDETIANLDEALAVFAIVNAITSNLPDVTDVQILELHKKGWLALIYFHLQSQQHWPNLSRMVPQAAVAA